jgi:hypothetical protein
MDKKILMNKALNWSVVVIAAVGALGNLPLMVVGFSFLLSWVRLDTSDVLYFKWAYLAAAAACVLFSGLGIVIAAWAISKRRLLASLLSLAIGAVGLVLVPEIGPQLGMTDATMKLLGHADHSLSEWDEKHGRFPSDETELREALATRPLRESAIFFLRGKAVPYDVRILTNAFGPSFETVPPKPGTIVYAISSDFKQYWLTITTLQNAVGGPVMLEHIAGHDEQPIWVMNRKHHENKPFIE